MAEIRGDTVRINSDKVERQTGKLRGRWGVGKPNDAVVEARRRARERRIAMETDRQQRDDRVDTATAAVILATSDIASAGASAAAAKSAARETYEAAAAAADRACADIVGHQEGVIGAAVRALIGEKLAAVQVAELTGLTAAEVRRFGRVNENGRRTDVAGTADSSRE